MFSFLDWQAKWHSQWHTFQTWLYKCEGQRKTSRICQKLSCSMITLSNIHLGWSLLSDKCYADGKVVCLPSITHEKGWAQFSFAENREKPAPRGVRQVLWGERPGGICSTDPEVAFPHCEKPLCPLWAHLCTHEQSSSKGTTRTSLLLCPGGTVPKGREWIQGDGTGLKAKSRGSITFLWSADFPSSFQPYFREVMMARRTAPFLPSGTHSWHILLVLIGITSE